MSEPTGGTSLLERTDLDAAADTPWQAIIFNEVQMALTPTASSTDPSTETIGGTTVLERVVEDRPWAAILWNDPVNLADVVVKVLVRTLRCDEQVAHRYMLIAHTEGKAAVFSGTQEEAQAIADKLAGFNLWATIEKAGA